jgi:KDO2-lipid IV(A) lauroyltransferase
MTPPVVRAYRAGAWLAQHAPVRVGDAVASGLGTVVSAVPSDRRFMAERNMVRVHGPQLRGRALARARREVFRSYARYWVESLRLPSLTPAEIDDGLTYEGLEHITEARARGIGAVVALPHLGGWEWSAFWAAVVGHFPVTAVVEELEPHELFEWFAGFRRSLGMTVVPLGPDAGAQVARALRAGHAVPLLCDRDIGGTGVEVEFFGERTLLPAGPVTVALRTGAPLLPSAVYFRGARRHAVIGAPMPLERRGGLRQDVTRLTQDLAVHLERLIRAAPEQWHLLQPNWPSDVAALEAHHASRQRHPHES